MTTTMKKSKPQRGRKKGTFFKWKPILLVKFYQMLKLKLSVVEMCRILKISNFTYYYWLENLPELKQVVALVNKELSDEKDFPTWIYTRLDPQLKELWDQIEAWEQEDNGVAKIELMLQDQGKRVRQQLFLHALCVLSFSPSAACRKVCVGKKELDNWINNDPQFAELVQEIQWHKGNFFESRLVDLVKSGEVGAILFANKTFNRERGYGQKLEVDHHHSGGVLHGVIDLAELMPYLSNEMRINLMDALRKKEEEAKLALAPPTIDYTQKLEEEIVAASRKGELEAVSRKGELEAVSRKGELEAVSRKGELEESKLQP